MYLANGSEGISAREMQLIIEEKNIFIWHKSGNLVYSLEGHKGIVNAVSWNPSNERYSRDLSQILTPIRMLASGSDDHLVGIWYARSPI